MNDFLRRHWKLLTGALIGVVAAAILVPGILNSYGPWADQGNSGPLTAQQFANKDANTRSTEAIAGLERKAQQQPSDVKTRLELAGAYLQRARETGDPALYSLADRVLAEALKLDPTSADIIATQGTVALARHDFALALKLGQQALATDDERSRFYGVVSDAQIELGQYTEALKSLQQMVERKPDFASFSRIAYARELYGDTEGAIEAMQTAIEAGSSAPENVAWAYAQIGNAYLSLNNERSATAAYVSSLRAYPNYAGALSGQARIAAANGDSAKAVTLYQQAFERIPLAEYAIALGDVYQQMGDSQKASRQYDLVQAIDKLQSSNGVNTDMELALFMADHGIDPAGSLDRARKAFAVRPSIHAADVLGWALYQQGKTSEALDYSKQALRLGTRDPLKLFHAGMIAKANGDKKSGELFLEQAVRLNSNFSLLYAKQAATALAEVRAQAR